MNIVPILTTAVQMKASDIFIIAGKPVGCKVNKKFVNLTNERLSPEGSKTLITELYSMTSGNKIERLFDRGDDDFSVSLPGVARFRVNTFKQRNSYASVIRIVSYELLDPVTLKIPMTVMNLADKQQGIILVTGPAGSGKSTTLACIIDRINTNHEKHIITLEDPIEYLHSFKKSIVTQREVNNDTTDFPTALRACLRQAPDVVLIGEMRDLETIRIAMTAAETGHLVFGTLHTPGAANTIDRIIDSFPGDQQQQIRVQLSMILQAVICQSMVPTTEGKMTVAFEIMVCTPAIKNLIREGKVHMIDSVITSSAKDGMVSMDASLLQLYNKGIIDADTLITASPTTTLIPKNLLY
jgi:twitching motility protein PilT